MQPITFECKKFIPRPAADICTQIADVTRWREFNGYGPLPGIDRAEYELRTENMLGSRIRVHNRDSSGHVEEIYEWVSGDRVAMKMHEFTPPLNRLATHFTEEWNFQADRNGTAVTRKFQLFPARSSTRPMLWLISLLFRRAIDRQLDEMSKQ